MNYESLSQHFSTYFNLVIADTPELLEEVFRIRYQVYCEELQYEALEKFPDQMEKDIYDSRSIHCLLEHKASGMFAGCVRAVLSDPQQPNAPFPFEKVCQNNLHLQEIQRDRFFEISRLAVPSTFRKRQGESQTAQGLLFTEEQKEIAQGQRRFPLIALSLYLACTSIAVHLDIDAFTLMEERLSRHLRRCGIPSHLIGAFTDYHGRRGPFMLKRDEVVASMTSDIRQLFDHIHATLNESSDFFSAKVAQLAYR